MIQMVLHTCAVSLVFAAHVMKSFSEFLAFLCLHHVTVCGALRASKEQKAHHLLCVKTLISLRKITEMLRLQMQCGKEKFLSSSVGKLVQLKATHSTFNRSKRRQCVGIFIIIKTQG